MALNKVNYVDNQTIITAQNLNNIQDEIINLQKNSRNILDNSDFRNPVNQRGETSWNIAGFTIDRWYLEHPGNGLFLSNEGITINPTENIIVFVQYVPKEIRDKFIGKTLTVVATLSDGSMGYSVCVVPNYGEALDSDQRRIGTTNLKVNIYTPASAQKLTIRLLGDNITSAITVKNIALYEGVYNLDNAPIYMSKGYGAEFASCLRYFERIGSSQSEILGPTVYGGTGCTGFINTIQYYPKRVSQPQIILNDTSQYRILLRDANTSTVYTAHPVTSFDEITSQSPFCSFRVNTPALQQNSYMALQRSDGAPKAYIDILAE